MAARKVKYRKERPDNYRYGQREPMQGDKSANPTLKKSSVAGNGIYSVVVDKRDNVSRNDKKQIYKKRQSGRSLALVSPISHRREELMRVVENDPDRGHESH
jgi:hypothetical protein